MTQRKEDVITLFSALLTGVMFREQGKKNIVSELDFI